MSSSDFKPGLEGVVAVETEIMEPDREGGTLRYRGVDVEPLIGEYPYENIWGLLVDDDIQSRMPLPEPFEPVGITGHAPADLQAQTARISGLWGLGKLNEISDDQAREDLGRISGQMMSIVARSARLADGHEDEVPAKEVEQGQTAAERFLIQWRGHADPRAVKAIDTYWICTAEHGVNAALVLDIAEVPPPLAPAMFACSRVAGWSAHILEQKRTGRLFRPSARYVGPGLRTLQEA
ncbi:MAG: hypothetical protein E6G16_07005 [Actinobacteria bacterium]|nr:MAG: hypothetical protein E6G16_07005 [Actinomycetota bacterium]